MDKAIQMVSELSDEPFANYVRDDSALDRDATQEARPCAEGSPGTGHRKDLRLRGVPRYGTGIMDMVEKGDT